MLSIVIPAFNEERRLPRTLTKWTKFLNENLGEDYEIIVVDDGSVDGTVTAVQRFQMNCARLSLVKQPRNLGRGAAVRAGIIAAKGEFVLETDSDGSVDEEAVPRFLDHLKTHADMDVLIGSRNLPDSQVLTPQSLLRVGLGHCFMLMARALFKWSIVDYTLGFKMFRREAALDVFSRQFDSGYLAEAEIVFVCLHRGWALRELPVLWTDYRDSRVHPFRDSWRSFLGLARILARKRRGLYD